MTIIRKQTEILVSITFIHGGLLIIKNGVLEYKGGTIEKKLWFDMDKINRIELFWALNGMGYELCGPLYGKGKENGQVIEIVKNLDLSEYLSSLLDEEDAFIYVDSPCDEPELFWKRVSEDDLAAHKARATIASIDGMCIKRVPKKEAVFVKETVVEQQTIERGTFGIVIGENRSVEDSSAAEGDEEHDAELDDNESEDDSYEIGFEDDEGTDDDAQAELLAVRKIRNQRRLESLRRNKEPLKEGSIKIGPIGIDKGFESYINDGNHYAGLLCGDEDYIGSSDVDSFASDDEEDGEEAELSRKRKTRVHYDPSCEEPLWELGMIFKSSHQFREALAYYAVKTGVQVYYVQNDKDKVRSRCSYKDKDGNQCPWVLYASLEKRSGDFRIKTYLPLHQCVRQTRNRMCNANFIAKHLKRDITDLPSIKIRRIQELLQERFEIYSNKTVCRRARDKVVKAMVGDYNAEFRRLFDYRDCLLETNPGSTCIVDVKVAEDPRRCIFKAMYVCFAALKEGFKIGLRRCIGFDGCFLKGVFKGQLLSVVAKNANNEIYPLAWAVVHNENTESWMWFIEQVRSDLNLRIGEGLTVVTDMQKGLENAICTVLPRAEHRECARHIC